jgi:hypothetical protein
MSRNRQVFILIVLTVVTALGWGIFASVIVEPNIEHAYRGEGSPMLTRAMRVFANVQTGESVSSSTVQRFINKWQEVTWRVLLMILLVGTILAVTSSSGGRRDTQTTQHSMFIDAGSAGETEPVMGRIRGCFVHAVIAVIVLGSLCAITAGIEFWPFSPYNMYATVQGPTKSWYRFAGVTPDGQQVEITREYMYPFDGSRLTAALIRLKQRAQASTLIEQALRDICARYHTRRQAAAHAGPLLSVINLYHFSWTLSPGIENVDNPENKQLVYAYECATHVQ